MRRMVIGFALTLAIAFPVPAPAAGGTAASETDAWTESTIIAAPVTFERDGAVYRLTLDATDGGDPGDYVAMTLRRSRDPDGDGPARSFQTQYREFSALDMVSVDSDLGAARIDTGDKIAPFGHVTMEFMPTAPAERVPCYGGRRRVREGRLRGTLRFASRTKFGALEATSVRARVLSTTGSCVPGSLPPSCPPGGPSVGFNATAYSGGMFQRAPGRVVEVRGYRSRPLTTQDQATDGYLEEFVRVRLPAAHGRLDDVPTRATVRGLAGTAIRGRATFTATSPLRRDVEECEPGRELVSRTRRGTIAGTLKFGFVFAPDEQLTDQRLQAYARYDRIRAAR